MKIVNRKGVEEEVDLSKISDRIRVAAEASGSNVDPMRVAVKVVQGLKDGITTTELDNITVGICINMSLSNPEYGKLGSKIAVHNHRKNAMPTFFETAMRLDLDEKLKTVVFENRDAIENEICNDRDYDIDYFGFKTLEKAYFSKTKDKKVVETPQYLWMRVALGLWGDDLENAFRTYRMLSTKRATHATPTLFNSGTLIPGLSSCFLMGVEDSIDGIYKAVSDCAKISKWAGGIGFHASSIRPRGSYISGTNGTSTGIIPMLKVFNTTARHVNQCFVPETVVYTTKGAKQIQHIEVGDEVLTRDGTPKKVKDVFVRPVKKETVHRITCAHDTNPLVCTAVHEIMIFRDDTYQFVAASEIRKGDKMVFPVPETPELPRNMTFDQQQTVLERVRDFGTGMHRLANCGAGQLRDTVDMILEDHLRDLGREGIHDESAKGSRVFFHNDAAFQNFRYAMLRLGQVVTSARMGKVTEVTLPRTRFMEELAGVRRVTASTDYGISEHRDATKTVLVPVLSNTEDTFTGKVYDLGVTENHNYLTECGLVHNSGRRPGSFAVYVEPWHGDIIEFLAAMRNHGSEESLARDLYYALWVPDLFMDAVKNKSSWYLMENASCGKCLDDMYGDEFELEYAERVKSGRFIRKVDAMDIWKEIIRSQKESGMPYIGFKDAVNRKASQKNLGVIKSSNLCHEINLYSDDKQTAVCNLASVRLHSHLKAPRVPPGTHTVVVKENCEWCDLVKVFLDGEGIPYETVTQTLPEGMTYPQVYLPDGEILGGFTATVEEYRKVVDHEALRETVRTLVVNLNRVIDVTYYPTPEARFSNLEHRPMGIGVQGLADAFSLMWIPYESEDAKRVNLEIFEAMYFYALEMSCEIAMTDGPYNSYEGSPMSQGILQFDMWEDAKVSDRHDWDALRAKIKEHGVRNSTLIALMPTASTAQIMGSTESFEAINSCVYLRRTLSGEFIVVNRYLVNTLIALGIWNDEMQKLITYNRGSVQNISAIPRFVRDMYRTIWEIKKRHCVDMCADRGAFVCQSQSFNLFVEDPTAQKLSAILMYGWKKGLKTGSYYTRTRPATDAQSVTLDPELESKFKECLSCGA